MLWIFLLFSGMVILYALLIWLPNRIVQPRRRLINLDPGDLGFKFEEANLKTAGGLLLSSFYVPATVPPRGNLVMLHGKDSAKEAYLEYLPQLIPYGYNVFLFDARAHGRSGGRVTTFGYHEWRDVVDAVRYLKHLSPGLPTGVFGHSMGGAVALQAMARTSEIDFGIIESAFTHLGDITHAYACRETGVALPRPFTDALLDRAERIADFRHRDVEPERAAVSVWQPVLVVHGEADRSIDADHGRRLYAALASTDKELYIVPGAAHDDLTETGGDTYFRRLRLFLQLVCERD
ncbi:alpha/beta hydrolase [Lewinella sp. IMCC34191]|uniref:alpha/beta hydrolase n=1 Tax=Lewinella sp. IMCC34191 TaxID=2259172 RepID=UPI000E26E152|nr:alpha/beta fold hydrolase [Lewinella sp. IMCC34191]